MANIQQLELQRQKLIELLQFLISWESEVNDELSKYIQCSVALKDSGLPVETYNKLINTHYEGVRVRISNIIAFIYQDTIPFIKANIEQIQRRIDLNR